MNSPGFLGIYIIVMALLQSGLYFTYFGRPDMERLFYFDPRTGIDAWVTSWPMSSELRATLTTVSEGIRWLSALWILLLGVLLLARKPVIKLYVVSESLLAAPSVVFFVVVVIASMSPAHGFSVPELQVPLIVFGVFTATPLWIGIRAWRKSAARI